MESNQNNADDLKERVDRNKKLSSTENLNYLYPNGHRITHQMRWFKGSRDRGLNLILLHKRENNYFIWTHEN